ncbi:PAS domain-containing protein [Methylobacterium planeticum]|uniref:PAS domain-containing protein n=1 Tax=Methylobacterium planeticum TaxID=2615211 RepID=A0A6N6MGK9_9HYPH|nr:PAS domain-containing protein [Methylobacterium planeticum]KAB1068505.1 PAS domain-containing protein [Methylobacterium planeticum]
MASSEPTNPDGALSESLRAALDASGVVGVWEWDITNSSAVFDQGAAQLLAGDGDLAGQALDLDRSLVCVHPDDSSWLSDHIRHSSKAGGPFLCEYRVCHPGQGVRWLLSRGRIELGPTGRPARGYGILIDVTETRLDGDGYFATPEDPGANPLERAADHCIAARRALDRVNNPGLRKLIDVTLWEIGRELARAENAQRRRAMN